MFSIQPVSHFIKVITYSEQFFQIAITLLRNLPYQSSLNVIKVAKFSVRLISIGGYNVTNFRSVTRLLSSLASVNDRMTQLSHMGLVFVDKSEYNSL